MRDTALGYRGPGSVPPWLRSRAEHAPVDSSRPLWGLLIAFALLVLADTAVSWVAFSSLASRHIPAWQGEWNPLTGPVVRAYGLPGMLAVSAVCILLAWVLMPVVWRIQWDFPESPATQALIRRLVLVTLVSACLVRGGVVGYDLSRFGFPPLGNPSSTGPGLGTAGTPTASATGLVPSPSPSAAASPTGQPHTTPTPTVARPTATPTATPAPSLTISPTPPGPVTACALPGNDATFTVAYVGSANPAMITVVSTSTSHYLVSLDGTNFGGTASGNIYSGTSATVWVRAVYNGGTRNINVTVTGFSQQTMQANTNGCGG